MIKLTIRTAKKDDEYYLPSGWSEVRVKHYLALEDDLSDLEVLSVLCGCAIEELENTKTDLSPAIEAVAKFLNRETPKFEKRLHAIVVDGKSIRPPKDIAFTLYGQKAMMSSLLARNEPQKLIADCFAIYVQPLIDGKFDTKRIPEVKKIVLELPIVQVQPWVTFFLSRLKQMRWSLQSAWNGYL